MHPRFLAATVGALVAGPMHLVERLRGGWEHAPDQASTTFESGSPQDDSEEKEKEASVSATPDHPISLQEQDSTITSAPLTEEDPAELNQAFIEAVDGNQWERVEELLLRRGDIVNAVNRVGQSALHIAAFLGHVEIVELLLSYKANVQAVDRDGRTALDVANIYEQPRVASLLADLQESISAIASQAGSVRPRSVDLSGVQETDQERRGQRRRAFIVETDDCMVDEEERSIFLHASEEAGFMSDNTTGSLDFWDMLSMPRTDHLDSPPHGHEYAPTATSFSVPEEEKTVEDIQKQLRETVAKIVARYRERDRSLRSDFQQPDMSGLHLAARYGTLEEVQLFLSSNPGMERHRTLLGHIPLHSAAEVGNLEMYKYLVSIDQDSLYVADRMGHFPLHVAAAGGHMNIVQYSIEKLGVIADAVSLQGVTALHEAAWGLHLDIAQYLIDQGADVNTANVEADIDTNSYLGVPVLHRAVKRDNMDMVKLLLDRGANIDAVDQYNDDALMHSVIMSTFDMDEIWPSDVRVLDFLFAVYLEDARSRGKIFKREKIEKIIFAVYEGEYQRKLFSDLLYDPQNQQEIGIGMEMRTMLPKTFAWLWAQRAKAKMLEAFIEYNAVSSNAESSNNPNMTDDLDQRDDNSMQDDVEDPEEEEG